MNDQAGQSALLPALTTEHFVAQAAASTIAAEGGTRATLYVMALSSSLVALGPRNADNDLTGYTYPTASGPQF